MKTLKELRDDLSHQTRSAADITEKHEKAGTLPTKEEQTAVESFLRAADEIKAEIEHREKIEALNKKTKDAIAALNSPAPTTVQRDNPNPDPVSQRVQIEIPSYSIRYGKLKAFTGPDAEVNAFKSGMALRALLSDGKDYKAVVWCEKNGINLRAMNEGSNQAGGALVPTEMSQAIIDLREQYGVFRRNTKVRPMGSDTMLIPRRVSGITASFLGEGTAGTASDKALDQVQLVAKKLYALTYVSTELAEDAVINLADDLAKEMAWAFAKKEDECGFNGDGTSTYGGIWGITAKIVGLAGAVDATSGHDTFAEVDNTDLTQMMGKLPQYARMGAKFYCSAPAFDIIFSRLAASAGGNTVQSLGGATQRSYLGYPIEISQVLPTTTSTINGTVMILFGDLTMSSSLGERRGIQVRRSDEIKFVEDQIAIKATERVDIVNHDLGDASTAGPMVALMGKS